MIDYQINKINYNYKKYVQVFDLKHKKGYITLIEKLWSCIKYVT